jgi:hypothetical protein
MHLNKITRSSVGADLSRPSPIMILTTHKRSCHPERSESFAALRMTLLIASPDPLADLGC